MTIETVDTGTTATADTTSAAATTTSAETANTAVDTAPKTADVAPKADTSATTAAEVAALKVPDAYKDKPWAKVLKTDEDLWKTLDGAQELIGKKTGVVDLSKMSDKERTDYYAQMRPAEGTTYDFGKDIDPKDQEFFSKILGDHGISKVQGDEVIKAYMGRETEVYKEMFGADGMINAIKQSFGDQHETVFKETSALIRKTQSKEDVEMINGEKLPNSTVALIHRIVNNMQKAYGATESGSQIDAGNNGNVTTQDIKQEQTRLRTAIQQYDEKPFGDPMERQKLVDQLHKTYGGK